MASYKKLLTLARDHMDADEKVVASVKGAYETKIFGGDSVRKGVMIATDRRVLFYAKKLFGYDFETFPYSNVSSIEGGKTMMGPHFTLFASGNKAAMKWITHGDTPRFIEVVRQRIGKQPSSQAVAPQEDIPKKISQLAELRDSGVITEKEFQSKKEELLTRL